MTDVRLTATNPEDSSVVPVACNGKGELLLEEPTVSSDLYVAKAGDTMTGNLHLGDNITLNPDGSALFANGAIDFYVGGLAQFAGGDISLNADGSVKSAGDVTAGGNPSNGAADGVKASNGGYVHITRSGNSSAFAVYKQGNSSPAIVFNTSGKATFASDTIRLEANGSGVFTFPGNNQELRLCLSVDNQNYIWGVRENDDSFSSYLLANGAANFAGDVIVGSRNKRWMIVESNGLAHLVEQTRNEISTADLVDQEPSIDYPPLRDIPGELTMVEVQLQKVLEKLRMVPEAGWEVWDGSDEN